MTKDKLSKLQIFLLILGFASLGAIISPLIFFILPTIIFGKNLGLYLLGLFPFCPLLGIILGAIIGIIITISNIKKYNNRE